MSNGPVTYYMYSFIEKDSEKDYLHLFTFRIDVWFSEVHCFMYLEIYN